MWWLRIYHSQANLDLLAFEEYISGELVIKEG